MAADAETEGLIRELARIRPDRLIASFLNRAGKTTGQGSSWTVARLRAFRSNHGIAVYREGEMQERNEMKLEEAAAHLSVSEKTVRRMIHSAVVPARQVCKGAPWEIDATALPEHVRDIPPARNTRQGVLELQ